MSTSKYEDAVTAGATAATSTLRGGAQVVTAGAAAATSTLKGGAAAASSDLDGLKTSTLDIQQIRELAGNKSIE